MWLLACVVLFQTFVIGQPCESMCSEVSGVSPYFDVVFENNSVKLTCMCEVPSANRPITK